ncbi:hypothetical protein Scep_019709 [Stephania cephalantha]|uniref:Uncharacterized protein n=1 Tax=Stephania cephalantha TaxID=152367 RepID=A0AAP0IBE3_9MAGN
MKKLNIGAMNEMKSRLLGEPCSYGGTKSSYMFKGLLGSHSNTVELSHPFLQGPLGELWMHDATMSPGPLEEPIVEIVTHVLVIDKRDNGFGISFVDVVVNGGSGWEARPIEEGDDRMKRGFDHQIGMSRPD